MQSLNDIDKSNEVYLATEYYSKIKDFKKIPHSVQVSQLPLRRKISGYPKNRTFQSMNFWMSQ